jgi:1,4-dihydroxy-2-naphthoate octaprenyltransferase
MEGDKRINKMTLIVRKGRAFGFTIMALGFLGATCYFAIMSIFFPAVAPAGFEWLALLSLIPTALGITGLIKRPVKPLIASKYANNEVAALFLFVMLVDIFLFFTII